MIAVTVSGNLGGDCRKGDHDGTPVVNFTVASRRYDKGEKKTDWVDVSFWGKRAESVAEYLKKGTYVTIRGTLWVREFTHNGEKRAGLACRADDVELGGGGGEKKPKPAGDEAASHTDEIPF